MENSNSQQYVKEIIEMFKDYIKDVRFMDNAVIFATVNFFFKIHLQMLDPQVIIFYAWGTFILTCNIMEYTAHSSFKNICKYMKTKLYEDNDKDNNSLLFQNFKILANDMKDCFDVFFQEGLVHARRDIIFMLNFDFSMKLPTDLVLFYLNRIYDWIFPHSLDYKDEISGWFALYKCGSTNEFYIEGFNPRLLFNPQELINAQMIKQLYGIHFYYDFETMMIYEKFFSNITTHARVPFLYYNQEIRNSSLFPQTNPKIIDRDDYSYLINRKYIKNGKLTALSQYQTECYFPEIHKRKDKIAALVQKFVSETLVNKLPEWAKEGSVADFAIIGEKVYVVELNPFATTSGACLFKWENDKAILYGDAPFEIRVVEKVVDHLEACFAPWSELMKEAEKKKGKHSWLKKKK